VARVSGLVRAAHASRETTASTVMAFSGSITSAIAPARRAPRPWQAARAADSAPRPRPHDLDGSNRCGLRIPAPDRLGATPRRRHRFLQQASCLGEVFGYLGATSTAISTRMCAYGPRVRIDLSRWQERSQFVDAQPVAGLESVPRKASRVKPLKPCRLPLWTGGLLSMIGRRPASRRPPPRACPQRRRRPRSAPGWARISVRDLERRERRRHYSN
jgi:hypothetical protein